VDDDPGIHEAFQLIFEDEYEILSALDGARAVEALAARPVDVMLLDIRMPGMGGLAVLAQARRLRPQAHVIVVSCVDQARTALEAIRLGAVDYVTKPFEADDLSLIVRKALEPPAAAGSASPRASIPHVLIISGDLGTRAGLAAALRTQCHVESVETLNAATATLMRSIPDLVVLDPTLPGGDPTLALKTVRTLYQLGPVIEIAPHEAVDFREIATALSARTGRPPLRLPSRRTARVIAQVIRNYPDATVEALARTNAISLSHLSHTFKDELGMMTPKDFITRVRIEAAKCLLRETEEKVETIARQVGLCDAPHLARTFRRHGEDPPTAFRRP
jgi:DNA-binding response OmpR family regulator/AraC-like DNA-binding protein